MQQKILNFAGEITYFEVNPGSDVWYLPLMPTTVSLVDATECNLPVCIKKYELIFRIGSEKISVRGKIDWDNLEKNVDAAFRYLEAADFLASRLVLNNKDSARFVSAMGELIIQTNKGKNLWTAEIYETEIIPEGYFVCETKNLE